MLHAGDFKRNSGEKKSTGVGPFAFTYQQGFIKFDLCKAAVIESF